MNPTTKPDRTADYIDPATLMRIKSLELRARLVVEGFATGLNKSPYHGFSVEFTEYRQYSPGDDLRYLDWKLYARTDRYHIKRFEDETNLRCHLLLDGSRSMTYGSLAHTKADYARTLTATLAYFLTKQRDAVGLVTFGERVETFIPARYRPGHLRGIMTALERHAGGTGTNLAEPLERVAQSVTRRGMFVLISDLLAPLDRLETSLGYLRARGHDVLVFQVLDPAERAFDFDQPALFHDVESGRELYVDPASIRERYLQKMAAHMAEVRAACDRLGATYCDFTTGQPLELALSEFLRQRMHGRAGRAARRSA
ncbi:MAG: DUF58 domain-containing protein [Planctomycetaceae bacterium]